MSVLRKLKTILLMLDLNDCNFSGEKLHSTTRVLLVFPFSHCSDICK